MISTRSIKDWLAAAHPEIHWGVGPDLPDKPDRAAVVTRGPGGRNEMEGLIDRGTFTIRMRGKPKNDEMPELDLEDIKMRIEATPFPLDLGGHSIISIWSAGPSYPLPGPDSGLRYEFVQTMNLQVSTDI